MKIKIYNRHEEPIAADDREYRRLVAYAAGAYATEEIEAWQLACANGVHATTPIGSPPAR